MKLQDLIPHLLYTFAHESDLLRAIEELSKKFTIERERIEDYLRDPRLASAYTAFYLSTNMPKFEAILPWFSKEILEEFKQCALIDVGSGPGTFSIAFREWKGRGEILQLETSELMRQQAMKLWQGLYSDETLHQNKRLEWNGTKLMLFGHSANEMGVDKVLGYIKDYDPEHILFIEPGTKDFFSKMLEIREKLLETHYRILYPCPNEESCPVRDSDDWCHQYVHVNHSQDVERMTQLAGKDRRNLPLTVHLYSRTLSLMGVHERILRVYPETKFSFEWDVCHDNHKEHYQLQKRHLSKIELKQFSSITPGDSIRTELEKEFEGTKRVRIKS